MKERKEKPMHGIGFRFMALMFKVRDAVNPPEPFLKETGMKEGDIILDYGCGPGSFVIAAAKIVGEKGKVYAVDFHPRAIKVVTKKAEKNGYRNIETIKTDCETGLKKNSIDIVIMYDVIHMLKEPENILTEMQRVLKKDGILSVTNPHLREKDIISKVEGNSKFKLAEKSEKTYSFTS